jgi:5-methylcytosine-specific restriction endonuclease McrA
MATKKTGAPSNRPDQKGEHRRQYQLNKKKILATQTICGICGKPVDMSLMYPHPLSACIDHIVPVAKGGHPSDINNLQLAHWACNRAKSDKMLGTAEDYANRKEKAKVIGFRNLPLSADWISN